MNIAHLLVAKNTYFVVTKRSIFEKTHVLHTIHTLTDIGGMQIAPSSFSLSFCISSRNPSRLT